MGLLDLIFGKKKDNNKTTSLAVRNKDIERNITDSLFIHQDLEELLWIADGIKKNYTSDKKQEVYEFGGIKLIFSSINRDEPSLIYTKLPLAQIDNIEDVERPPYYPNYSQLTPQQKGVYWKLLFNPYDSKIDIGFVFILYYGLERHLLNGNYEKAFRLILKLRDTHTNKSFQQYSGNALILTCLCRQRADLAFEFMQSLNNDFELKFSDNLFILCKYSLDIPLTSKDIMRLAKPFEFTNTNYIKNYPEIFEEMLQENIKSKYVSDSVLISNFITQTENKKARKQSVIIFANMSIMDKSIEVPMLIENFKLKKAMNDLLEITHDQVKTKIAELRKSGELKEKGIKPEKVVELLIFDKKMEKELLLNLDEGGNDFLQKHFVLISLQNFYYKYRDIDNQYLEKCIECCYIDINSLGQMQKSHYDHEIKQVKQLASIYSKKETDKRILEITKFNCDIPAFNRLAIIFEKKKDFHKAIEICDIAIIYYKNLETQASVNEFETRKVKLRSKVK
ncbi:TerB N-terminal domain-containing protein [Clostridium estertheticum]|uniref:TerB N-terminal domain-containing protein n=1 Tax=Clostridium estertheticum TaxID=238834 RepID=UPI001C0C2EFC|nr:TerB N-terminal domain-containing protein [Clostridium estertheticum]MBU3184279.1 TerB N-terminal domain-containing protein [Clostridium estertheticum]